MKVDPELVRTITQAVLEALGRSAPSGGASVKSPIGLCTGDYSQFPELAGKLTSEPVHASASTETEEPQPQAVLPATPVAMEISGPVLKGVITAGRLAGLEGTIFLADAAQLSPLAMDVVRNRKLEIKRVSAAAVKKPTARWTWWMQGFCPSAARVAEQFSAKPVDGLKGTSGEQLAAAIGKIRAALENGKVTHGVLFVPDGTAALCLANKVRSLRAIAGTTPGSVIQNAGQLGANVLVIEYPIHGYKAMNEMITGFLSAAATVPMAMERQLRELGV